MLSRPLSGRPDQPEPEQRLRLISESFSVSALATEHVLCPPCRQSVIDSHFLQVQQPTRGSEPFRYTDIRALEITSSEHGCHLCSLFLGKIRHLPQTTGSITVTLHVSRSGGVMLSIKSDEAEGQRMGELSILPVEDIEDHGANVSAVTKFILPNQKMFKDAQLAKSLSSDASFNLAREWLQQCLYRHPIALEQPRPHKLVTFPVDSSTSGKVQRHILGL